MEDSERAVNEAQGIDWVSAFPQAGAAEALGGVGLLGLVDTYCHLDSGFFDVDRDEVVVRARDVGVTRMIVPAVGFRNVSRVLSKVAKNEKDVCALIDAGFEYFCDFDEHKIFRKRK